MRQSQYLKWLMIFGGMFGAAPIAVYVWRFNDRPVSDLVTEWGAFGDYVGGLLGALFGFLAFLGVVVTAYLQERRSSLDELQRLLASESKLIDDLLASQPRVLPEKYEAERGRIDVSLILTGAGLNALDGVQMDPVKEKRRIELIGAAQSASVELAEINSELDQLVWLLKEFIKRGGGDVIESFYVRRYRNIACYLNALGFAVGTRVGPYFEVDKYSEIYKM